MKKKIYFPFRKKIVVETDYHKLDYYFFSFKFIGSCLDN